MFGKLFCKLGFHKQYEFTMDGLFTIQKCSRCGLVFHFTPLTDKLWIIAK